MVKGEKGRPGAGILGEAGGRGGRIFVMNRYLALCFALPAAGMLVGLACTGVWPFGGRSVLTIDLYHMYATLIAHLHDMIYGGAGGTWSWNIGLGINYFTLYLTNVGSPLNALIALFPKTILPDLIGLGVLIKAGLSGLCMGWLLRYKWRSCEGWTAAFATLYALCGWMTNYYWNIMWSDLLVLLPLCLLGIELLVDEGRFMLYVLALVAAMVCNYYIAALMCVFLVLYFAVTVLSRFSLRRELGWVARRCLLFGGMSLLAAGIAACCLLPVARALGATSVISDQFPKTWEVYHNFFEVVKNAYPGAKANIRSGGLPHIYAGLLSLWLLPFYLTDRGIGRKARVLPMLALVLMVLCMNFKVPDFIWHGLHSPNDLPFRYSFCISALMVVMAYPAARRIDRRRLPWLYAWGGVLLVYLYATELLLPGEKNLARMIATPVLMAAFGALFYLCLVKKKLSYRHTQLIAVALVAAEMTFSAAWSVWGTGNTLRDYYVGQTRMYDRAAREVTRMAGDDTFYRMETARYMTFNDPALYGFKGLSHFSSMLSADLQDLMHRLGYHTYMHGAVRANRQAGQPATPVTDALLGVRYHLVEAQEAEDFLLRGEALREKFYADDKVWAARNLYALPLAFTVREEALDSWNYSQQNPFAVQNEFVKLATGTDGRVLNLLRENATKGDGLRISRVTENHYRYSNSELKDPGEGIFIYSVSKPQYLYLYADGDQLGDVEIRVEPWETAEAAQTAETSEAAQTAETSETSETTEAVEAAEKPATRLKTIKVDCRYPRMIEVGQVLPGELVTVSITLGRNRMDGDLWVWMNSLNLPAFEEAMGSLAQGAMTDMAYGASFVSGTVEVLESGRALFTSIPADQGWQLYIDGRPAKIETFGGALIGARLPVGVHTVDLRWQTPGLDLGLKISACSVMLLVLLWAVDRLRPPSRVPAPAPAYTPGRPELEPPPPEAESGEAPEDEAGEPHAAQTPPGGPEQQDAGGPLPAREEN